MQSISFYSPVFLVLKSISIFGCKAAWGHGCLKTDSSSFLWSTQETSLDFGPWSLLLFINGRSSLLFFQKVFGDARDLTRYISQTKPLDLQLRFGLCDRGNITFEGYPFSKLHSCFYILSGSKDLAYLSMAINIFKKISSNNQRNLLSLSRFW